MGVEMFKFEKFDDKRLRDKNRNNRMSRFGSEKHKNSRGQGRNSFKYSVHKSIEDIVNTLDLGKVWEHDCEKVIHQRIQQTIENNEFPLRVLTHSNTDKIISFKRVMESYPNLKTMNLDFSNPFTYTVGVK